jgi:uncharacterized protein
LVNFMQSEFITWMDRHSLERPGEIEPDPHTEEQEIIHRKGLEHERAYLGALAAQARSISDFSDAREHFEQTLAAMRRGDDIIYQGYLANGEFAGYPDFLVRVPESSALGEWSYEPWDTKLARRPKPYFAVQLCCYAEMLDAVQGVRPTSQVAASRIRWQFGTGRIPHGRFLLLLPRPQGWIPQPAADI